MTDKEGKFDFSTRVFIVAALAVAGLIVFFGFRAAEIMNIINGNYNHEITVDAQGKAYAVPDVAELYLGVHSEGAAADAVINDNTKKMNDLIAAVKKLGVETKDIQTTNYTLSPRYQYTEAKGSYQDGYTLDQSVTVTIRDLKKVGDVMAASTGAGANTIGNISFKVEDPEKAKAEARKKAIANAEEKAKDIAEQTGLKLGRVVNFYEYQDGGGYYDYGKGGGGGVGGVMSESSVIPASPSIEPGQQEVILTVNMTYRLK